MLTSHASSIKLGKFLTMEFRISRTSLTTILRHKPVPTQEISSCSPASTSDLSDSNSSTSSPTSSSSSHSSFDQAEQAEQQLKPLKLATWETENDILYTNECFPTKYGYYMDNPYAAEPIELAEGARIKIVDEISDRMARVEELDTGKRGLVPQYILEDPLERLARLNTIDNEIVRIIRRGAILEPCPILCASVPRLVANEP